MNAFFILARMDSSRLPGKAFLRLGESTLLGSIIERLQFFKDFTPIVLTSDRKIDDCIETLARGLDCLCYRGEINDVAGRIAGAIDAFEVDAFFRINGDSPCLDEDLIKQAIQLFDSQSCDFISNIVHRSYPYGVAVELFSSAAFIKAQKKYTTLSEKEHPTIFFYNHLEDYKYLEFVNDIDLSCFSLTIDTLEDYVFFLKLLVEYPDFLDIDLTQKIKRLEEISYD